MVLYSTSFTNVLFPEPETPVTHVNTPSGNFTFIFLRLFSVAPTISSDSFLGFLEYEFVFFLINIDLLLNL